MKYLSLRIIAWILMTIGSIFLFGSIIVMAVLKDMFSAFNLASPFGIFALLSACLVSLLLIAIGQLIYVFIDIEKNTRTKSLE